MNYEKTKKRNKLILIALLLMISLGYALLNANLRINGTSKIKNSSWDIHWNNVQVTSGSVSIGTGDKAAVITPNDTTEVTYEVTLAQPGDFYEFTVDAVNAGSIDAMIDVITSTYKIGEGEVTTITSSNLPVYLNYSVSYSDGTALAQNQELNAGETETYKVRVEYKKDIENNQLVGTDQSIVFSFAVDYVQKDDNAVPVQSSFTGTKYTTNLFDGDYDTLDAGTNNSVVWIGRAITNNITQYDNAQDAMNALKLASGNVDRPFYLKHTIVNDVVTESYVEFVITDALKTSLKTAKCNNDAACEAKYDALVNGTYSLRGLDTMYYDSNTSDYVCKTEYDDGNGNCVSPYHTSNVATIKQAFGTMATDTSVCHDYSSYFGCSLSGLFVESYVDGDVRADDGSWFCGVGTDGTSECYEH